jgi:hypothetical protein
VGRSAAVVEAQLGQASVGGWEAWLDENGASSGKPVNQAATLFLIDLANSSARDSIRKQRYVQADTPSALPTPGLDT